MDCLLTTIGKFRREKTVLRRRRDRDDVGQIASWLENEDTKSLFSVSFPAEAMKSISASPSCLIASNSDREKCLAAVTIVEYTQIYAALPHHLCVVIGFQKRGVSCHPVVQLPSTALTGRSN